MGKRWILGLGVLMCGCSGASAVCPIVNLADQLCPIVMVKVDPDAGPVPVPKATLARAVRASLDGGK